MAETAEDDQEASPMVRPPATRPRNDSELEGPAHLGAPFVSGNSYGSSSQSAIRGLVLLVVVAFFAFAAAIRSGNPVAIGLGSVLLVATLAGTVLMFRRAVRAEVRRYPRETPEQRHISRGRRR